MNKRQLEKFVRVFNSECKYTKVVGMKKRVCWELDIKVLSSLDGRRTLCRFFLNVWPETSEAMADEAINDKYRGMREFLDCNPGIEEQVTFGAKEV
jgi:hypothetical protein